MQSRRAVFIDLSEAFDTISHSVLLNKLQAYGIKGNQLLWFSDYLFDGQQYLHIGSNTSPNEVVFSGVPQGSILGPLPFIVFYKNCAIDSKWGGHLTNS